MESHLSKTPPELLQGTVDILILRALARESMHGYAISRWLDQRSEGKLTVDGAGLYQALHRLEQRKLIAASWGVSENNRRAKYYRLTPSGKKHLLRERENWQRIALGMQRILEGA